MLQHRRERGHGRAGDADQMNARHLLERINENDSVDHHRSSKAHGAVP
jgi:hypothetical protein